MSRVFKHLISTASPLRPLAVTLFGLLVSATAHAAPRILRFNVSPAGYPPYTIVHKDGSAGGIMWDVLTRIAVRHGIQVKAVRVPRKRVDTFILDGRLDATARAIEWTAHPERFVFTRPIVNAEEVFFSLKTRPFQYATPDSIRGETIVTHLGYKYPKLKTLFDKGAAKRFDVERDSDMFRYVLEGKRFHELIAERHVGQWIIRQHDWKGRFTYDPTPLTRIGFPLMFNPQWKGFVAQFNRDLRKMRKDGELAAILAHYH